MAHNQLHEIKLPLPEYTIAPEIQFKSITLSMGNIGSRHNIKASIEILFSRIQLHGFISYYGCCMFYMYLNTHSYFDLSLIEIAMQYTNIYKKGKLILDLNLGFFF